MVNMVTLGAGAAVDGWLRPVVALVLAGDELGHRRVGVVSRQCVGRTVRGMDGAVTVEG